MPPIVARGAPIGHCCLDVGLHWSTKFLTSAYFLSKTPTHRLRFLTKLSTMSVYETLSIVDIVRLLISKSRLDTQSTILHLSTSHFQYYIRAQTQTFDRQYLTVVPARQP